MLFGLGTKITVVLMIVAVIAISAAVFMRNLRKTLEPVKPEHTYTITGKVVEVLSANRFSMIEDTRRTRKKPNVIVVTLEYVTIVGQLDYKNSVYGLVYDQDDALGLTIGLLRPDKPAVKVIVKGRKLFSETPDCSKPPEAVAPPEAKGPITGVAISYSGADVGLELVKSGFATVSADAPKEYISAAKAAAKKKKK
jgi:hypothetical protein